MKVKDLIEELKRCEPNSNVEFEVHTKGVPIRRDDCTVKSTPSVTTIEL
jgi:hypothetical protein